MNSKLKLLMFVTGAGALFVAVAVAVAASSPSVQTRPATDVQETSAVLRGTVNPNGSSTRFQFQWGLTNAYGLSSRFGSAGHGTTSVAVHAGIGHLLPGTVYHFRLTALSRSGTTVGQDRTFKTTGHPPAAVGTGPATQPSTSGITLTGIVNPNHVQTSWYFNYGLSTVYGSRTIGGVIPANSPPVVVSERIEGLASGTIFHYQLVAVNRSLPRFGADSIFMTFPNPAPKPTVRAHIKPGRDRHKPFAFTTSGSVSGPSAIPALFACSGNVRIRFQLHRRWVNTTIVPLAANCTFSSQAIIPERPGRGSPKERLRVVVHYFGNGYLAASNAKLEHVTVG